MNLSQFHPVFLIGSLLFCACDGGADEPENELEASEASPQIDSNATQQPNDDDVSATAISFPLESEEAEVEKSQLDASDFDTPTQWRGLADTDQIEAPEESDCLVELNYSGAATEVMAIGTFSDPPFTTDLGTNGAIEMVETTSANWEGSARIASGTYAYQFKVDSNPGVNDVNAAETIEYEETTYSKLIVACP